MKQIKLTKLAALAVMGLALATSATAGQPNYLLKIDLSDLSAVTITATTNAPWADDNTTGSYQGVDLLNFFTSSSGANGTGLGNLGGGNSGDAYDLFNNDNASDPSNQLDLWLTSTADPSGTQTFSTSSPAFTGSMTIDLSSFPGELPSAGATGSIMAGNASVPGQVIGEWEVISAVPTPEPGTLALAGIGGIGAFFFARRRK